MLGFDEKEFNTDKELKEGLEKAWDDERKIFADESGKAIDAVERFSEDHKTYINSINAECSACRTYINLLYDYLNKWYPTLPKLNNAKSFKLELPKSYKFDKDKISKALGNSYKEEKGKVKRGKAGRAELHEKLKELRRDRRVCSHNLKSNRSYYEDLIKCDKLYLEIIILIKDSIDNYIKPEMDWINAMAIAIQTKNAINNKRDVKILERPKASIFLPYYKEEADFLNALRLYYEKSLEFYTKDTLNQLSDRSFSSLETEKVLKTFVDELKEQADIMQKIYKANAGHNYE